MLFYWQTGIYHVEFVLLQLLSCSLFVIWMSFSEELVSLVINKWLLRCDETVHFNRLLPLRYRHKPSK